MNLKLDIGMPKSIETCPIGSNERVCMEKVHGADDLHEADLCKCTLILDMLLGQAVPLYLSDQHESGPLPQMKWDTNDFHNTIDKNNYYNLHQSY